MTSSFANCSAKNLHSDTAQRTYILTDSPAEILLSRAASGVVGKSVTPIAEEGKTATGKIDVEDVYPLLVGCRLSRRGPPKVQMQVKDLTAYMVEIK